MAYVFSNIAYGTLTDTLPLAATTAYISPDDAEVFATPTGGNKQVCRLWDDTDDFELVAITTNATGTLTLLRAQEGTSAKEWPAGTIITQHLSKAVLESLQ